jgi:hypothetical protein
MHDLDNEIRITKWQASNNRLVDITLFDVVPASSVSLGILASLCDHPIHCAHVLKLERLNWHIDAKLVHSKGNNSLPSPCPSTPSPAQPLATYRGLYRGLLGAAPAQKH